MRELAADFLKLCSLVPGTGRLNMKLMPPEVKDEIRAFVEKVSDKNADCDREFKRYVAAATALSEYYADTPETHKKAGKSAYDDMMNRLGNTVLKAIGKTNGRARDRAWEEKRGAHKRETIESLVTELFGVLARAAKAEEGRLVHARKTGELSRQAKKELAVKLENSSNYDWER
jgi:hypothetical protein